MKACRSLEFLSRRHLAAATVIISVLFVHSSAFADDDKPNAGKKSDVISGFLVLFDYTNLSRALSESDFFVGDYDKNDWFAQDRFGFRLQLRASDSVTNNFAYDLSVNLELNAARPLRFKKTSPGGMLDFSLREGFITYRNLLNFIDLKFGRQYIFWGRFEWGGALDFIAPWDFTHMGPEKENFRLATYAAKIIFNFGSVSLETLIIPYFTPTLVPLELPSEMAGMKVVKKPYGYPGSLPQNWEYGAKLNFPLGDMAEMSLNYYRGYDRNFSMYVTSERANPASPLPDTLVFAPAYKSVQVVGLDGQYILGPVMLLGEAGYFHTADSDGNDPFIKNRNIKAALGFEWEAPFDLSIQAMASYTYLIGYDRTAEWNARKNPGQPDPYVPLKHQSTIMARVKYALNTEISFQALNLYNLYDNDFMLLAFASIELVSDLKLYAGVVLFRGKDGTTFGRSESNSQLFAEMKWNF